MTHKSPSYSLKHK